MWTRTTTHPTVTARPALLAVLMACTALPALAGVNDGGGPARTAGAAAPAGSPAGTVTVTTLPEPGPVAIQPLQIQPPTRGGWESEPCDAASGLASAALLPCRVMAGTARGAGLLHT